MGSSLRFSSLVALLTLLLVAAVSPCISIEQPRAITATSKTLLSSSPLTSSRRKSNSASSTAALAFSSGGAAAAPSKNSPKISSPPSMYWAVFHNWLYFLSLGFNAINVPFVVRSIVDGSITDQPSPEAIALSGHVEAVDKLFTFCGIGFLSSLSDKYGRRPLMAWAALGFMLTNIIQALTTNSIAMLYFADFVDGCSSCMLPLCQAYVTDVSAPSQRAANLGIFQGLSAGCAFILAFPIGGLLGAKYGPRLPLYVAAALQLLNATIIWLLTPESNLAADKTIPINWKESNPLFTLKRLFGHGSLLRITSVVFFLAQLARSSLDAQFINYSNLRFGWSQAQSGPVLVVVGLMLAVSPRLLVPLLGLQNSILAGLLITALGLTLTGLAPTSGGFIGGIFVVSIGCVCYPALQALLANLAPPGQRGALLGAAGSLLELTGAIGSTLYASILGLFTSDNAPLPIPGMHFLVGGGLLVLAWAIALRGFAQNKNDPALHYDDSKDKTEFVSFD